jgi:hypothetical protein
MTFLLADCHHANLGAGFEKKWNRIGEGLELD